MSNPENPKSVVDTSSVSSTQLSAGYLIDGKYEILEKVGHGGMGMVYRAKHLLMDREVALKVLHPHLVENEEFLKRFRHEAQIASKLNHPNAVTIYDFGITGKLPYLVMEFVQGETLKDLIAKKGAIPVLKLEQLMSQVFSALVEAHRLGIIHRDLKPDNFILSEQPDGTTLARVLDFGIAKLLQTADAKQQTLATQAGIFFGTPRYASPEQALGKELDARADIYALGVILFEALTGEVPFDAPSMMELLLKHLNQPPPPIRSRHPELGIPLKVEEVVQKCLEKDRDKRFQNVKELSTAFKEASISTAVDLKSGSSAPLFVMGAVGLLAIGGLFYFGSKAISSSSDNSIITHSEESSSELSASSTPANLSSKEADVASAMVLVTAIPTVSPIPSEVASASSSNSVVVSSETQSVVSQEAHDGSRASEVYEIFSITPSPIPTAEPTPSPKPTPLATKSEVNEIISDPVIAIQKAEQFYRSKSYSKAIPLYEQGLAIDTKNKKSRLNLGICYLRIGSMEEAFKQFHKAFELDHRYPPTLFNLACYYAMSGQKEAALKWLELTIEQEPAARSWARSEGDLSSIKNDPRFNELIH